MCFDKTGTLTEEGLSVFGAQPVENDLYVKLIGSSSRDYPKKD
jgi:magnesium-transporting ATPase (P-type)